MIFPTITPAAHLIPTCAGVGGGWRRIAHINISAGDNWWRKDTHSESGVSFCPVVSDGCGCSSAYFSTNGISYQRVCGRVRGYQKGATTGFYPYHNDDQTTIDSQYTEGLLITYNNRHQHIWTYATSLHDDEVYHINCQCAFGGGVASPPLVGTNYYCESGTIDTWGKLFYYFSDPLWDGSNCYRSTNCWTNPTLPWFYWEFSQSTTGDIEARICHRYSFTHGSTLIDQLELYIQ